MTDDRRSVFPYDRRRSQNILRSAFRDPRSSAIVCDPLRSCDHMETKVLRSAIETYPVKFEFRPTIQRFLATKQLLICKYDRRSQKCVSIWSQTIAEHFAICDPRSAIVCDHMETSLISPPPVICYLNTINSHYQNPHWFIKKYQYPITNYIIKIVLSIPFGSDQQQ